MDKINDIRSLKNIKDMLDSTIGYVSSRGAFSVVHRKKAYSMISTIKSTLEQEFNKRSLSGKELSSYTETIMLPALEEADAELKLLREGSSPEKFMEKLQAANLDLDWYLEQI